MNELMIKNEITSLELVEQVNLFRKQEGNRAELKHKTMLDIIRDEFAEEIAGQKILLSEYKDSTGRKLPMFILSLSQAKQVLVRESKFVRKAVIAYIDRLEQRLKDMSQPSLPKTYLEALKALVETEEAKQKALEDLSEKAKQLDEAKEWYSIKRYAKEHRMNWRSINWRALKALSHELGYEVQKIFDGNYGEVNIYHKDVFDAYFKK